MIEKTKKLKKGSISEEDICILLQRYSATTILALLREVLHYPDVKIDWNALVKNTSTGISDAREYQMLWHHLAYRHNLLEKLEDGAQILDNDSDLEYEVEAFPPVSSEVSKEAATCVKVLIASSLQNGSSLPNRPMVEAPLTINIPNGLTSRVPLENSEVTCSMQGMNITVPVSVPKYSLPVTAPAEGLDATGTASGKIPPRKKRKHWSEAEDLRLIAAVQKCGEGNWANILRDDFKGDRTASQLSQRWNSIRKRNGNLNVGANSSLSEAWRAAHHAMSLALDMPVKNRAAPCSIRPAGANTTGNSVLPNTTAEAALVGSTSVQGQHQPQQDLTPKKPSPMGLLSSTAKSLVSSKKSLAKPTSNSDSLLRAAAVAAGARIASSEDAQSLIKAAQAKNAVHIMPTGGSSIKLSKPGGLPTHSEAHTNVHYISTGLSASPTASCPGSVKTASQPIQLTPSVKTASPTVQHTPSTSATFSNMSSEQTNAVSSSLPSELLSKEEVRTAEERKVSESGYAPKEEVQEDGACVSRDAESEQVQEDKAASPNEEAEFKNQLTDVEDPSSSSNMKIAESDHRDTIGNPDEARQDANDDMQMIMGSPVKIGDNQSSLEVNCENQSTSEKQVDMPSMIADGCEKLEVLS